MEPGSIPLVKYGLRKLPGCMEVEIQTATLDIFDVRILGERLFAESTRPLITGCQVKGTLSALANPSKKSAACQNDQAPGLSIEQEISCVSTSRNYAQQQVLAYC